MTTQTQKQAETLVFHYDDIPQGGFAGIVEKQMVISPKIMPGAHLRSDISHGLGGFVYLATGHFKPNDGAPIHPHVDVDIVTLVLSGKLAHKGTLGDGTVIDAPGIQVQRAGSGIEHAEFNPEGTPARFVQIWFQPPENGLKPEYQNFELSPNKLTTVLGVQDSDVNNNMIFNNPMTCKIGTLDHDSSIEFDQAFIIFITQGCVTINGKNFIEGDLVQGESLNLEASEKVSLVLIHETENSNAV